MVYSIQDYLLTISAQQKGADVKVKMHELEDIQFWLEAHGVVFICRRYESTGKYAQLHFHGLVRYKGQYNHLTKWGDLEFTNNTFIIHFSKVRNYKGAITYLLKAGSRECVRYNKKARGTRDSGGLLKPGDRDSARPFRVKDTLSQLLKRTL